MHRILQTILLIILFYPETYGQEIFFKTGKNFTDYDFKPEVGLEPNFLPGWGDSYELGFGFPLIEKGGNSFRGERSSWLRYEGSLTLDSYDAYGGDLNNNYSWETTFAGIRNRLSLRGTIGGLELGLIGILGASKMITGTQVVNKSRFDLRNYEDFSGVFVQGGIGASASFSIADLGFLSLSYDYTKSFRVGDPAPDRLRFSNQRIGFGLHFNIE